MREVRARIGEQGRETKESKREAQARQAEQVREARARIGEQARETKESKSEAQARREATTATKATEKPTAKPMFQPTTVGRSFTAGRPPPVVPPSRQAPKFTPVVWEAQARQAEQMREAKESKREAQAYREAVARQDQALQQRAAEERARLERDRSFARFKPGVFVADNNNGLGFPAVGREGPAIPASAYGRITPKK
jgi:DNA mismatch repair ATPase MutL